MTNQFKIIIIIILIFTIILTAVCFFRNDPKHTPISSEELAASERYVPTLLYGINVDSMLVTREKIKRNEFLADILLRHNVNYPTIDKLARDTKKVYDVRKMRHGNYYSVITTADSIPQARYFVYEISPTEYVKYTFSDSVFAYRGFKEIETRIDTATGIIKTSLWNAMIENNTDPNLANELSEIYAWTIDFFGIQKDDKYKVIYENQFVDGERIGIGRIHAALFNHWGADNWAFYFVQDSVGDYFDEQANSLRRAFLKAPLHYRRISSGFSYSRMHPILKYRRPHLGVDYAANHGTPVMSVGDGIVEFAKWDNGGGGRTVKIKHNGTYTTLYMHLSNYGKGIKSGAKVKQGQVIGYVGSSGLSTGPHLDFRFYRNGKPVDPLKVESPPVKPVDTLYLRRFHLEKQKWIDALNNIDMIKESFDLTQNILLNNC
jgi:murein DD-endopeptidase MepM/ murein hydrolase activator NlpD